MLGIILSGYGTLRKFYEIRNSDPDLDESSHRALIKRRLAATSLIAVIASADHNIRGGLYDPHANAVVSEDFLLALLGEASVFVSAQPSVITLEQMDTLLKAVEDIQTVGSRVYDAADEFFGIVLASAQGLKGSTPADLLKKSTSSLSGSSYMMSGSSMLASQLQRSISGSGVLGKAGLKRGWDWRTAMRANTTSVEVLKGLRTGLARDLARLWLEEADNVAKY
jgi:hypothetical protein